MNQEQWSQGYPPYAPAYPKNKLLTNYYNRGPNLIVAQPNQLKNAVDNIIFWGTKKCNKTYERTEPRNEKNTISL